jgi:tRNA pseudouridine38-40 synthase
MLAERTLKLTIEYDGTDFNGFQTQNQGERTVQGVLTKAIERITQQEVTLTGAGRTDTGVHALGQVVSFTTPSRLPIERLAIALNSVLPPDIAVAKAEETPSAFHARFSATRRTYLYSVWTRRTRSAFWGRYALHLRRPVDIELMRSACQVFTGSHDFASFAKAGGNPGLSTVRQLDRLTVRRRQEDLILFRVSANGFLRSMVRNIVGSLLKVGLGELSVQELQTILKQCDRNMNPIPPAAAHGLCLLRVDY